MFKNRFPPAADSRKRDGRAGGNSVPTRVCLPGHLYHHVSLDFVVLHQVVELLKYKAALIACRYLLHIILKPL